MTRKSKREIENTLDRIGSDDSDETDLTVTVSWEQPADWEPDDDALVVDFTEVDT